MVQALIGKTAGVIVTIGFAAREIIGIGSAGDGRRDARGEIAIGIVFIPDSAPCEIGQRCNLARGVIGKNVRAIERVHNSSEPGGAVIFAAYGISVAVHDLGEFAGSGASGWIEEPFATIGE